VKSKIRILVGIAISAILIYYLATSKSIDWPAAWLHIQQSNKLLLVASGLTATAIFALRAIRWRYLLPQPAAQSLRFSSLWEACIIGQMATNVIPGRAGEVARPIALAQMEPTMPFSTGLASVVVDRVLDGIVVLLLLLVAMLDPRFPRNATIRGRPVATIALLGVAGLVVGLIGLFWLVLFPHSFVGFARRVIRPLAPSWEDRAASFLERFTHGLTILRDPGRFGIAFFWALAHWLVCAASYWLGYKALGIDAPLSSTLFTQTMIVLAVAIPQAPGFVGVFEAVAAGCLTLYGVPTDVAVAWAVAYHVASYIPVTGLGLIYFARLGLSFKDIRSEPANA
jgi:uncharacterized protein (TIRG00374 family)